MTGLLVRGPGALSSPAARWAVSLLAVAGAALLVWSCVIHLMLWTDGYRSISVVGPLFLIQGVGGIAIAVLTAVLRWLALIAAAAATLVATAVGLLLSVDVSLFGYRESLAVPYAKLSLAVEFTGAALLVAAAILLLAPARRGSNPLPSGRLNGTRASPALASGNGQLEPAAESHGARPASPGSRGPRRPR